MVIRKSHPFSALLRYELNSYCDFVDIVKIIILLSDATLPLPLQWIAILEVEGTMMVKSLDMAPVNHIAPSTRIVLHAGLEALLEDVVPRS